MHEHPAVTLEIFSAIPAARRSLFRLGKDVRACVLSPLVVVVNVVDVYQHTINYPFLFEQRRARDSLLDYNIGRRPTEFGTTNFEITVGANGVRYLLRRQLSPLLAVLTAPHQAHLITITQPMIKYARASSPCVSFSSASDTKAAFIASKLCPPSETPIISLELCAN